MKKILVWILAAILIFSMTACGTDTGSTKGIGGGEKETKAEVKEATIDEQVCFEHDGVKVTATAMKEDSIWGTGVQFLVENDTDKDYSVSTHAVIVNNCMISSLFSCQVAAGKKANDTLYLSSDELEEAGITEIGQIEVYFYIYDDTAYETVYEADCTTIKTSLYDTVDMTPDDAGQELYNSNGIRIIGKSLKEDEIWGPTIMLYIENNSGKNIAVSCDDLSVNGFMVSELFSSTVFDGKYAFDGINISESSLEENNIMSIETVELKFEILDADTFRTIAETDAVTLTVSE